jgi:SAM-dependent methyltransferase
MRPPTETAPSLYDDPRIYDILMTPGTCREVDVLAGIARRHGILPGRSTPWLEPACGTGRFLRLLAGRGQRVIGFDSNAGQLAYARSRLRRLGLARWVRLFEADMTAFADRIKASSIAFAFNPVNSLRHLPSDGAMLSHLTQMARVLRPGGLYAVGISLRGEEPAMPEEDVWLAVRGRCRVTQLVTYLPPPPQGSRARRETVISHLMIERPGGIEHFDSRYELRTYRAREWSQLVSRSPLRRLTGLDARGRPLPADTAAILPYQIEILTTRI